MHAVGPDEAFELLVLREHPDKPKPILACGIDGSIALRAQRCRPRRRIDGRDVPLDDRTERSARRGAVAYGA
jgi:hypothetical protein